MATAFGVAVLFGTAAIYVLNGQPTPVEARESTVVLGAKGACK